jgi:hypothetical protein
MQLAIALICFVTGVFGCARSSVDLPRIGLSPSSSFLSFSVRLGEAPSPQTITVVEAATRPVRWRATPTAAWIVLDPIAGTAPAVLRVTVIAENAAPGTSRGAITFEILSDERHEDPQTVIVERTLEAPGWTSLDGPYAGHAYKLAVDPANPERILAGVEYFHGGGMSQVPGGLYVSADRGASFDWVPGQFVRESVVDLVLGDTGRGYAASVRGLYRTDDRGVTWQPTSLSGRSIGAIAMSESDPNLVLAIGGGTLWGSADGGATPWTEIPLLGSAYSLVVDAANPGRSFASDNGGHLYWLDGTSIISTVAIDPAWTVSTALALPQGRWLIVRSMPSDCADIMRSDDQGATWTLCDSGPCPAGMRYALLLADNRVWLATAYDGLWVSEDQGESFFAARESAPTFSRTYLSLTNHPDGLLAAHATDGILRQTADFVFTPMRFVGYTVYQLEWLGNANELVALTSLSAAYHWSGWAGFEPISGSGYPDDASAVTTNPDVPSSACVLSGRWGLYCTIDNGRSWTAGSIGLMATRYFDIDRVPGSPDVMWVGTNDGLFRSTDGVLFERAPGTAGESITRIAAVSRDVVLYGPSDLRRYDWAASSYTVVGSGACFLTRAQDGSFWHDSDCLGSLHRSTDGGLTFSDIGPTGAMTRAVVVDPTEPRRLVLGYDQGLVISLDDGATWSLTPSPFPVASLALDPASGDLYVGTSWGGIYRFAF